MADDSSPEPRDVIVFGLSAVRNVGEAIVDHIVATRESGGPFVDFYDFCRRVDPSVLNKRAVESLVKGRRLRLARTSAQGALPGLRGTSSSGRSSAGGRTSRGSRPCSRFSRTTPENAADGRSPASYDGTWVAIPELEFDKAERLAFEKEMLGLYVSDHPLMGVEQALRNATDVTIRDLLDSAAPSADGAGAVGGVDAQAVGQEMVSVTTGGVVTALARRYTRRGELMATFVLEDLEAAIEVMVFPKTMLEYGGLLAAGRDRGGTGPARSA